MVRFLLIGSLALAPCLPAFAQTPLEVSAAPGIASALSSSGRWAVGAPDASISLPEWTVGLWSAAGNWTELRGPGSFPIDVSTNGDVVLANADTTQPFVAYDQIWVAGQGWQPVPGPASRDAVALSDNGEVVIGHDSDPAGPSTLGSYTWNRLTGTLTTLLPSDPGHLVVRGVDMTADGLTVVGYSGLDVVTWDEFGIPTVVLPGGGSSTFIVRTISADGTFIVGARDLNSVRTPFIWSAANGIVDLPALGAAGVATNSSIATDVSTDGQRVIGIHVDTSDPLQFTVETFIWTPAGGTEILADWLSGRIGQSTFLGNGGLAMMSDDGERFLHQSLWIDIDATVGTSYCSPQANSTGQIGRMGAEGSVFAESNELTLTADRLPANQFGIFVVGTAPGSGVGEGGSLGICIAGQVGRFQRPGEVLSTGPAGRMELTFDLASLPLGGATVNIQPGDTWYFTAWHREPMGLSALTDGLRITFE